MTQILRIPDIGEGDQEATVITILVTPGASVDAGEPILEIETDKATMEVPAEDAGTITSLLIKEGDKVTSGADYAHFNVDSEKAVTVETETPPAQEKPLESKVSSSDTEAKQEVPMELEPASVLPSASHYQADAIIPAGPGTRRLARELGVDLSKVQGTDRKGRINKRDVKAYIKQLNQAEGFENRATGSFNAMPPLPDFSAFGEIHKQSLSSVGLATSKNMVNAWSRIPHAWLQEKMDITELEAWRQANKAEAKKQGGALTITILLAKAVACAIKEFPIFNSSFDESNNEIIFKNYRDISIAIDTEQGLLVPVLRAVDQKGLIALSKELLMLSEKARTRKLGPKAMQGGGITISNLGGMGLTSIFPIVNWPQVAIIGVAANEVVPCYREGNVVPRRMMTVTLGFDHRVINGADGARFMGYLKKRVEDPRLILL